MTSDPKPESASSSRENENDRPAASGGGKRKDRRPLISLGVVAVAALALALFFLLRNCKRGGGEGTTSKKVAKKKTMQAPTGMPAMKGPAHHAHCHLRVDNEGLKLDGMKVDVAAALTACKKAGKAELQQTGHAIHGDVEKIRQALRAAMVPVLEKKP